MSSYDDEVGAGVELRGGEYVVELGDDRPGIRVVSAGEHVDVHIGPAPRLVVGGRWRVVLERQVDPGHAPGLLSNGRQIDLPLPPAGSRFQVMVLAKRDSETTESDAGGWAVVESQDDLRIEILAALNAGLAAEPATSSGSTPHSPHGNPSRAVERDGRTVVTLFDGELDVHYGFFSLTAGDEIYEDLGQARAGQANGLCGTKALGQVSCVTGLHTGQVPLRIEWLSSTPEIDPMWEDVVEASVELVDRHVSLSSFEDGASLELPHAGWHRVRYCVRAMDAGREMDTPDVGESAPDRYLVQLWPTPPAPDEVLAVGSQTAAYWHRVARGEER